ncbi:malate dehydrogenase [Ophiocordyceps camponoti-floridani]|uniref:Malate dehydrogenase n=1 Tax=Ophiocordyceps camponoti-floridani TaxID=2030778 RepID=A0A8H4Q2M1_9HYPO|nr:malate dehydrogenase [Ophiocordyceps camponoti-floridani]
MRPLTILALGYATTASAAPAPANVSAGLDDNAFDSLSAYFKVIATGMQQSQLLTGVFNCDVSKAQMPSLAGLSAPKSGLKVHHVALGRGTQNYTCSSTSSAPKAAGAVATLFDASCVAVMFPELLSRIPAMAVHLDLDGRDRVASSVLQESGVHFFTDPSTAYFDLDTSAHDYGKAPCAKLGSVDAPADAARGRKGEKAVAWLRLKAKAGATDGIREVYRVSTAGGSPPATCEGMPANFEVPYSAVYWFWQDMGNDEESGKGRDVGRNHDEDSRGDGQGESPKGVNGDAPQDDANEACRTDG